MFGKFLSRRSFLGGFAGLFFAAEEAAEAMNITISIQGDGSALKGIIPVTVEARPLKNLSRVSLSVDGTLVGSDVADPFVFQWDTTAFPDGKHTLLAQAYYKQRVSEASLTVWVANTVEPPPPPPPPPPPTDLPFAEADLRSGYRTYGPANVVNAQITLTAGYDALIDLDGAVFTRVVLVWGQPGQRIQIRNAHFNIPLDSTYASSYWRGGLRLRTTDSSQATGPEHVSVTDCLVRGAGIADGFAIACGKPSRVTIQRCRIESASQTLLGPTGEPAEHCDGIHVQGSVGILEVGLVTIFAADQSGSTSGGKCFMLNNTAVGNDGFDMYLRKVNMRGTTGGARCDVFFMQDDRGVNVNFDEEVYAYTDNVGRYTWNSGPGSGLFYPNNSLGSTYSWSISGSSPTRVATWNNPSASNMHGSIKEGLPPGGDYVTRAHFGL